MLGAYEKNRPEKNVKTLPARLGTGLALFVLASLNTSWDSHFNPSSAYPTNDSGRPALICQPNNLLYPVGNLAGGWWPGRCVVGQVGLCYFWAPWCQPCQEQTAWLNALWLRYRPAGLVMVGFCLDADPKTVLDYYRRTGMAFPSALAAPEQVNSGGALGGLPTLYLLSGQGEILRKYEGLQQRASLEQDILAVFRKKQFTKPGI